MNNLSKFDKFYLEIKRNRWYWYFSILCRFLLAFAFIAAGFVKVLGERFANGLPEIHPMGSYLTALYHTGYYYPFIGYIQIMAAILLIIPRTVALGAVLYFPIIINICVLSLAVKFEGSLITSQLMVLANLYILVWNYDRLKYLLPFKKIPDFGIVSRSKRYNPKFPFYFFLGVIFIFIIIIFVSENGFGVMPRNSFEDCMKAYINTRYENLATEFCNCVHTVGNPLDACIEEFSRKKELIDLQ